MPLLYKLPEEIQTWGKEVYYFFKGEHAKQFALLKMKVELSPDNTLYRGQLAWQYWVRNHLDEAIAEHKRILQLDPQAILS